MLIYARTHYIREQAVYQPKHLICGLEQMTSLIPLIFHNCQSESCAEYSARQKSPVNKQNQPVELKVRFYLDLHSLSLSVSFQSRVKVYSSCLAWPSGCKMHLSPLIAIKSQPCLILYFVHFPFIFLKRK